jgi:phosphoglycolate phosphatase
MYSVILFDLDGTIDDSCEGIIKSARYALSFWGIEATREQLRPFIGPPLTWSFPNLFHIPEDEVEQAVERYREYYAVNGIFEGKLYDGVVDMLVALKAAGFRLAVATSKPEMYARPIIEHYGITHLFEEIAGSPPDESGGKAAVIADVLSRLGNPDKASVLMVGDREHDIEGAKTNGLASAGVLWGYGSYEELTSHSATHIVATPQDLVDFLLK